MSIVSVCFFVNILKMVSCNILSQLYLFDFNIIIAQPFISFTIEFSTERWKNGYLVSSLFKSDDHSDIIDYSPINKISVFAYYIVYTVKNRIIE